MPDFLWAMTGYLTHTPEIEVPGWDGLASFLHEARNGEILLLCFRRDAFISDPGEVSTMEDFVLYLVWLCNDFTASQRDPDSTLWPHPSLPAWLEAWAAWVHDSRLPATYTVTWRSCAEQLAAARVYE